ncbi:hypothetical protein SVA_0078 [Sulfurifustis variabilis]|uniref:YknX-like C-terminal permuted SH3-like domain-containing protein n=1 Tax=Sulfurifustis variabilis TaxID=1675686 RepID=A0A1B4UZT4_9GAMM|nr:hypothetical protein [Sulfurifustis variabilis]BAU46660.1 hypothetical protein SVA_0078 [Sulfurifustis variabilis]
MTGSRLALLLALAGIAGACTRAPAPTPPVERPALERPTATVAKPARGNAQVPRGAVVEIGGVPGVYVLEGGHARFRMVRVGTTTRDRAEVISGLEGGEVVVLGDLAALHDGSPVTSK